MANFCIVVTGGIGSGKTQVTNLFAERGIEIVDADCISRELVTKGQPLLDRIAEQFGAACLTEDGELNRPYLRQLIFANPTIRQQFDELLHPPIRQTLKARCENAQSRYVMAAVPLFTEGGGKKVYPWVQRVLVVDTDPTLQIQRVMARDNVSLESAQNALNAQASRAERLSIADDLVKNDREKADLQKKVALLDIFYTELSRIYSLTPCPSPI